MDVAALRSLLEAVRAGVTAPDDAMATLQAMPFTDLGFARVDHHRALRQGRAEAVYAPGKSVDHIVAIVSELLGASTLPILVSRANAAVCDAVLEAHPDGQRFGDPDAAGGATLMWRPMPIDVQMQPVAVVTAGTADLPVADECAWVLEAHGIPVTRYSDVGVAGLHRLLASLDDVRAAQAVVVVAGMEGALASVIGGLVAAPVVAVPTSVGYGSGLDGVTALLAMTASCASGITVVGIDNGFGAANAVLRIVATMANQPAVPSAP